MSQLLCDVPKLLAHVPKWSAFAGDCCCWQWNCSSCKEPHVPVPAWQHWMAGNEVEARVLVTQPESVCPEKCKPHPCVLVWLLVTHLHSGVDAHCSVSTLSCQQTCTADFEARAVLALICAVAWHLEHVNQNWPRYHLWGLRTQPTKPTVHCGYLWLKQLARAGWSAYNVLLALLGLGSWTRCSGGRRGLEVPASKHLPGSPAQVCTAYWGDSPALTGEAAAQPFPETNAASTVVRFCFFMCLECTALVLEAVEKRPGGYRASWGGGLNKMSWSCQPKFFIRWPSTKPH